MEQRYRQKPRRQERNSEYPYCYGTALSQPDRVVTSSNLRTEMAFGKYNRIPNSLLRDPGELDIRPQHAKRSWEFWKRDGLDEIGSSAPVSLPSLQSFSNSTDSSSSSSSSASAPAQETPADPYERLQPDAGAQYPIGSSPNFKKGFSFLPEAPVNPDILKHRAIPAPTLRYDPDTMTLRERRFLGLPYGGTVVVHYLKRNEWFLETALALLGREQFWDTGLEAPAYPAFVPSPPAGDHLPPYGGHQDGENAIGQGQAKKIATIPTWNGKGGEIDVVPAEWGSARMYGSPLVKENGYVALGRTVPWDALQKSEEGKYGKLRGSPRQRYADMPDGDSTKEKESTSSSSSEESPATSSLEERSSSLESADLPDSHTHTSFPASSLESQSSESSTATHSHTLDGGPSDTTEDQSSKPAGSPLEFQQPAALALNLA